jgi:hypothetical protein
MIISPALKPFSSPAAGSASPPPDAKVNCQVKTRRTASSHLRQGAVLQAFNFISPFVSEIFWSEANLYIIQQKKQKGDKKFYPPFKLL